MLDCLISICRVLSSVPRLTKREGKERGVVGKEKQERKTGEKGKGKGEGLSYCLCTRGGKAHHTALS